MRPFSADALCHRGEVNVDIGFKANIGNAAVLTGINYFNYSNPIDNNKDNFTDLTLQDRISVFQNGVSTERTTNYSLAGRYFMKTDGEANNGRKIPRWN
jgi:outer membrane receptor for ferrienterochelin and colicins